MIVYFIVSLQQWHIITVGDFGIGQFALLSVSFKVRKTILFKKQVPIEFSLNAIKNVKWYE